MNTSKITSIFSGLDNLKWNVAFKGVIAGIVAGLFASAYRFLIDLGLKGSLSIYGYLRQHLVMIPLFILLLVAAGALLTWFVRLEPMTSGSGIPQVEGLLLYGLKMRWFLILPIRFAAGFLSSLFGVSLGREGPSIQIGASSTQMLAKGLNFTNNKLEENYLITGGAAAGLSAAFSAPLSGIMFALEEVHRSFSPNILIAATTASLTANVISNYLFGLKPELSFLTLKVLPVQLYLWLIPVGILSGVMGCVINRSLLKFQSLFKKIPVWMRATLALLIAMVFGLTMPELLGGGLKLIELSEKAQIALGLLVLYIVAKLLFTCTSFGSGIPGGIFMPILSIGAMTGCLVGLAGGYLGLPAVFIPNLCVCAMAGALSGSVKAPVTSILLTAEMTGSLAHTLPVAFCAFCALLVSDLLKTSPIYESLLERLMEGRTKEQTPLKAGAIMEIPVEFGSKIAHKRIHEVQWPEGCLIAAIHRGEKEMIAQGNTMILPGDFLFILSSDQYYNELRVALRQLCRAEHNAHTLHHRQHSESAKKEKS